MTSFVAQTYQNEYLPVGATEVNAIVTVTALGGASARTGGPAHAAEVVIVDCSGSMSMPALKWREAKAATCAAIDAIRDGVAFAVIAGTHGAQIVYPADERLVAADAASRQRAKKAVGDLKPKGGTAIGKWLGLAAYLFHGDPEAIHHAILLTDGQNEHESVEAFEQALAVCQGRFQCDCRGVGTDWEVDELRKVATALLGTVDIIAEPQGLVADFTAMIDAAMGKDTKDVALRLWTPQGATVAFVKQVAPTIEDLTARATTEGPLTADYPTGAWGAESRDYHICVHVPAHAAGEEMAAGRFSLMVDGEVAGQALIRAVWTDDERLSTRISREVAHYTGETELMEAIQDGLLARRAGDEATATMKLGRAVQLAAESNNTTKLELLAGIVEVDDAASGTVRLRRQVQEADEMTLDTRSTKTMRISPAPAP
jgi:von Willebrand factor type A C-terminal domain/von Willebrand factor type A domain